MDTYLYAIDTNKYPFHLESIVLWRLTPLFSFMELQLNLSKLTDHGTDFKWRDRELEYQYNSIAWAIDWNPKKGTDIEEWSVCRGGRLERFDYYYTTFISSSLEAMAKSVRVQGLLCGGLRVRNHGLTY